MESPLNPPSLKACLSDPLVQGRLLLQRLRSSPLGLRFARGAMWSLAGSVASRVLALGAAILVARLLGKASYGELGIIQSTLGMFGTLAGFGMGTTTAKFVAELRERAPARAGRIIGLSSAVSWGTGIVLAVLLAIAAPWLCRTTMGAPHLTEYVRWSALLVLFSGVSGAQLGSLSGFEAFRSIARVTLWSGLLNFPFVVGGAVAFGLAGVVGGMVLSQGAGCLLGYQALKGECARYQIKPSFSGLSGEMQVLWHFSLPAVLGGLLMNPVQWICATMLVQRPQGFEEVGAFNAANQWFGALLWVPNVLAQAVLPMLAERYGANDFGQSSKLLVTSIKINALVATPLVLLGCLLSPWVMAAYGADFRHEWHTLVAVLLTAGLASIQIPVGNTIAVSGRMWLGFCMNLAWSVVFLAGTWLMLAWGSFGLASARFLAYVAQAIWAFTYAATLLRGMKSQSHHRG